MKTQLLQNRPTTGCISKSNRLTCYILEVAISGSATGETEGDSPPPPNPKSRQKLSKKNGIKLVGYTFRLKNHVKIATFLPGFSELAPPLVAMKPNVVSGL